MVLLQQLYVYIFRQKSAKCESESSGPIPSSAAAAASVRFWDISSRQGHEELQQQTARAREALRMIVMNISSMLDCCCRRRCRRADNCCYLQKQQSVCV
jgi:hypothetical protein